MVNHDTDLFDVTVRHAGTTSTLHTTSGHPFWSNTRKQWVRADQLTTTDTLTSPNGEAIAVVHTQATPSAADRWDLTIDTDHDFYVSAGDEAVLVHNCPTDGGNATKTAPSLRSLAAQIRTAGRAGAAANQRTIAVGEDAAGNLYAGSSGGFDAGQRAAADALGIARVPSRTVAGEAMHAEENLLGAVPDLRRVGTSVRMPCGPSEHNCAALPDGLGVVVDR